MGFVFVFVYVVVMIFMGWLVDRYFCKNFIVIGVFVWSIVIVLSGLVCNYGEFMVVRMGVGVGELSLGLVVYFMIIDFFL